MASAAQVKANTANAQMSTGPRTEAGKSKSKNNSMAHGLNAEPQALFAHAPLLAEAFQKFCAQLLESPALGKSEELAFERWAFSAFQASRAKEMEAMAESDARINFGDDHFERRWQRMVQTRLRLDRDAAAARKVFYAIQNERLCMEAEHEAQKQRSMNDRMFLQNLRDKAKERDREYQNALLAYRQRLAKRRSPGPPPKREMNLDLVYQSAPDMSHVRSYIEAGIESCNQPASR